MTAAPRSSTLRAGISRDALTWYCYLSLGFFTYLVSIQGNILPFLQAELALDYAAVSLHTSAIAAGMIAVGLFGERMTGAFGRRAMMAAGCLGASVAAVLLAVAPAAWATIGSCLAFGTIGAFIPAIVPAVLSGIHRDGADIAITESNASSYAFAILAPIIAGVAAAFGWSWRVVPLAGAAMGAIILVAFLRTPVPDNAARTAGTSARLPASFWAYWAMLGCSVAVEFSILLWAPAFLERVVGLSASAAALGAASFFAAMLLGRSVGIGLVRAFDGRRLFLATAATTVAGFAAYWGTGAAPVALAGLFVVGLGISLMFPLALSLAMQAAGEAPDRAATRTMLAPGLAILISPPLLGAIADRFGLAVAQLTTPVFVGLALVAFVVAERLRRLHTMR